MTDAERDHWRWRQWELIGVQRDGDSIVLDVLELPDNPAEASTALMTIELLATDPGGNDLDGIFGLLEDWVGSDRPCGVLHPIADPFGSLALFQDLQVLVFNTA